MTEHKSNGLIIAIVGAIGLAGMIAIWNASERVVIEPAKVAWTGKAGMLLYR